MSTEFGKRDRGELVDSTALTVALPFGAVIFFTIFTFLNLPYRIHALGAIRPTVIATIFFTIIIITNADALRAKFDNQSTRLLIWLVAWVIITFPLVRYPGSILHKNFEIFAKWAIFFPLIVAFVDNERRLRIFVYVFVAITVFRCLDPLYLHYADGYWGSKAYWNSSGHFMNRLSGARWDVVDPNGLAEICAVAVLFLHNWSMCSGATRRRKLVYFCLAPLLVWTIILSGSRSGFLALALNVLLIIWFSKRRALGIAVILLSALIIIPQLSPIQRDRFESIYDSHTKNASTTEGRIIGLEQNLRLFMRRPLFGFGLGTSLEASFNYQGGDHMAHDIYTQTLIELGIGGFIIMMGYMISVYRTALRMLRAMRNNQGALPPGHILLWLPRTLLIWAAMNFFFDLASYGLSSYEWYFLGGLTLVTCRLLEARLQNKVPEGAERLLSKDQPSLIPRLHSRRPVLMDLIPMKSL